MTGQGRTGDRQAVARRLEGRVLAQRMAIVGILIPTGYLKHALMDQVCQRVLYVPWVPTVAYRLDDAIQNAHAGRHLAQQHHPAVAGEEAPIEGGFHSFAAKPCQRDLVMSILNGHGSFLHVIVVGLLVVTII